MSRVIDATPFRAKLEKAGFKVVHDVENAHGGTDLRAVRVFRGFDLTITSSTNYYGGRRDASFQLNQLNGSYDPTVSFYASRLTITEIIRWAKQLHKAIKDLPQPRRKDK